MLVDFTPLAAVAIRRNRKKKKKIITKRVNFALKNVKRKKKRRRDRHLGLNNVTALN
jgi:hypothetical protein